MMQEYDALMEARRLAKRLLDDGVSVGIPGSGSKLAIGLIKDYLEEAYNEGVIARLTNG